MASIRLSKGKYRVRVFIGRTQDGKQKFETGTFDSSAAARAWAATMESQVETLKKGMNASKMPFETIAREWLAFNRSNLRPRTSWDYEKIIERELIPYFGKVKTGSIMERDVKRWVAQKVESTSTNTTRKHFYVLRAILRDSLKERNPAKDVSVPKNVRFECQPPTPQQLEDLLYCVDGTADELVIRLISQAGVRLGETFGLTFGRALAVKGGIMIERALAATKDGYIDDETKSHRSKRPVAVPARIQELIWQILEGRGGDTKGRTIIPKGFIDQRIVIMRPDSYTKRYKDIISKHNAFFDSDGHRILLEVNTFKFMGPQFHITFRIAPRPLHVSRLYDLRHHHASAMMAAGLPDQFVARRLGHAVGVLHNTYQHLFPEYEIELNKQLLQILDPAQGVPDKGTNSVNNLSTDRKIPGTSAV